MTRVPPHERVLAGCTMVIAAERRASDLALALERRGAAVYAAPPMRIVPNTEDAQLVERTRALITRPPDVVVATTGVGFRAWIDTAHEHGLADELLTAMRGALLVARGPKANGAIQQAGLQAPWVAASETVAEVGAHLIGRGVAGLRIAVQHHGAGSDDLDDLLRQHGAEVVPLTVYRWAEAPDPALVRRSVQEASSGRVDGVLFTSAPGAARWLADAGAHGAMPGIARRAAGGRLLLAAVGPVTAAPLREAGLPVEIAPRGRLGSLARCVIDHFANRRAPWLTTAGGTLEVRSGGAMLDGDFIALSPAGADLLGALFDARGNVLTRAELARELPRAGATLHAVEMAVARVREALGGRPVVQTVVKRGYRLQREDDR